MEKSHTYATPHREEEGSEQVKIVAVDNHMTWKKIFAACSKMETEKGFVLHVNHLMNTFQTPVKTVTMFGTGKCLERIGTNQNPLQNAP